MKLNVEISGNLDRASTEALHLEILQVARRHGLAVESSSISRVDPQRAENTDAEARTVES